MKSTSQILQEASAYDILLDHPRSTVAGTIRQMDASGRAFLIRITASLCGYRAIAHVRYVPYGLNRADISLGASCGEIFLSALSGYIHFDGLLGAESLENSEHSLRWTIRNARVWALRMASFAESGVFSPPDEWAQPENRAVTMLDEKEVV